MSSLYNINHYFLMDYKYQLSFCACCLKNAGIHDLFYTDLTMLYIFLLLIMYKKSRIFLIFFVHFVHDPLKYFSTKCTKNLKKIPSFCAFCTKKTERVVCCAYLTANDSGCSFKAHFSYFVKTNFFSILHKKILKRSWIFVQYSGIAFFIFFMYN